MLLSLPQVNEANEMRARIIRIGNSLGVIIPAKILKTLSIKESDEVNLELRGQRLIFESLSDAQNPFASLDRGGWNDDPRSAEEIADELYEMRHAELERGIVEL